MEIVEGFNVLMLGLPVALLILAGLFVWYRHGVKAEVAPYVLRAIAIVYEFSEEQLKDSNPIYTLEKRALVDMTYDRVLPLRLQAKITRAQWAVLVETAYEQAAAVWDDAADGLRESFREWEASEG